MPSTSLTFVSAASIASGTVATYNLRHRVEGVKNCRRIGKRDMKFNDTMPRMRVDPETYVVEADGKVCAAEPAGRVAIAQGYFFF